MALAALFAGDFTDGWPGRLPARRRLVRDGVGRRLAHDLEPGTMPGPGSRAVKVGSPTFRPDAIQRDTAPTVSAATDSNTTGSGAPIRISIPGIRTETRGRTRSPITSTRRRHSPRRRR